MKPMVSICCITYNHEKYIAKAIDSFLMQETEFDFEIIIHDDASTDNTANIIKMYEKKYPEIIKPIYQVENQFSKGEKITFGCVFSKVRGEFIAFCEGDDYWNDRKKLQTQVEFLSKNTNYSSCFHSVRIVDIEENFVGRYLGPKGKGDKDYKMDSNIRGGFIHISSILMRSDIIKDGMPKWALESRHGDYVLSLFLSANGKVHYIDITMSSYRTGVEDSVMTKIRENYSKENDIEYHNQRIITLQEANQYYNLKYDKYIRKVIYDSKIRILILENKYTKLLRNDYREYLKEKRLIDILKIFALIKLPITSKKLSFLKGEIMTLRDKNIIIDKLRF